MSRLKEVRVAIIGENEADQIHFTVNDRELGYFAVCALFELVYGHADDIFKEQQANLNAIRRTDPGAAELLESLFNRIVNYTDEEIVS